MNLVDPDGNAANVVAGGIGALIGGALGFAIEGGKQLYDGEFNAKSLGAATAGGAVAGGLAGLTFGASLGATGTGAVIAGSSAAGGSTTRALMGENVNTQTVATDAVVGLATAGILKSTGVGLSKALPNANFAKVSGQMRDILKGQGNFGIGSGTRAEAKKLGETWVGEEFRVSSNGEALISSNGLRQYRAPSVKPRRGGTQANFEQRSAPNGKWEHNAHMDIKD